MSSVTSRRRTPRASHFVCHRGRLRRRIRRECPASISFPSRSPDNAPSVELPAPHSGRLTHKGTLAPLQCVSIEAKLWVTRPGTYALDTWTLDAEVGEVSSSLSNSVVVSESAKEDQWRTRQRYELGPQAGAHSRVTVVDTSSLHPRS